MGRKNFPVLGERLKALRRERPDLTQEAVAEAVGVKQPTYAAWESGAKFPSSADHLRALCRLYDVSSDWLLGLVDERRPWPKEGG